MLSVISTMYYFFKINLVKKYLTNILVLFVFMASSLSANAVELGEQAIDFELKTFAGEEFKLSDYKGKKPVYLIFWATWCPICKAEIPKFKELHSKYGEQIEFLAINVGFQDTLENAIAYKSAEQLPYKVAFDQDTVITKEYDVVGTPWQVIIDINGVVRYFSNYTPEKLGDHIDSLLKKSS